MGYPYETATDEQRKVGAWWWCVHHDVHCEPLTEPVETRVAYIRKNKPPEEVEIRLSELRPVLHPERIPESMKAAAAPDKLLTRYYKMRAASGPELAALHLEEYPDTKCKCRGTK